MVDVYGRVNAPGRGRTGAASGCPAPAPRTDPRGRWPVVGRGHASLLTNLDTGHSKRVMVLWTRLGAARPAPAQVLNVLLGEGVHPSQRSNRIVQSEWWKHSNTAENLVKATARTVRNSPTQRRRGQSHPPLYIPFAIIYIHVS
jgi:hypothetical protein